MIFVCRMAGSVLFRSYSIEDELYTVLSGRNSFGAKYLLVLSFDFEKAASEPVRLAHFLTSLSSSGLVPFFLTLALGRPTVPFASLAEEQ